MGKQEREKKPVCHEYDNVRLSSTLLKDAESVA